MRAVVQRAREAAVSVGDEVVGEIDRGLVVLVGISVDDTEQQVDWLVDKVVNLRLFPDDDDKMNRSVAEVGGAVLVVSQFTLYGDARKGRRPSFVRAAGGPEAQKLYELVAEGFKGAGIATETGEFGAMMDVSLTNWGPVTILLDSEKAF